MRKFLATMLAALSLSTDPVAACVSETTHNYYLFDVVEESFTKGRQIGERCNKFWENYSNGEVDSYRWNRERLMEIARQKGDNEVMAYMTALNSYLDISEQLAESWSYPTKEELAERQQTLQQMARNAQSYRGTRLKAQWALLFMRANMVMKKHQTNVDYWQQTASKLPASVYREMMENIYAGALQHTGHRKQAIDLFAQQGDMTSVAWLLRKHRNLEGIKSVYSEDANSPALPFLVQDFVNNAQETLDQAASGGNIDAEWMDMIGARVIRKQESDNFIAFANQVIKEGKTQSPALWKAAIGELQYLYGDAKTAVNTLNEAMKMKGTQRMKDCARIIRMVASARANNIDKSQAKWLSGEMGWLVAKANEDNVGTTYFAGRFPEAMERLVYMELIPKYQKMGQRNMAIALFSMMENEEKLWRLPGDKRPLASETDEPGWNEHYSYWSEFVGELNAMSASQLVDYAQWFIQSPANELEKFAKENAYFNEAYFNDMAATHYMAEGKFAEAVPLLRKVPLSFMEGQNISYYLAHRDFTKARWKGKQAFDENIQTEGTNLAELTDNPKLRFCEQVIDLQSLYNVARTGEKERLALQLATLLYQASHLGDCWFLTHYGQSVGDAVEPGEMDFVGRAKELLKESRRSTDTQVRMESLYALAFIPKTAVNEWGGWYGDNEAEQYADLLENRDLEAMKALNTLVKQQAGKTESYISRCDVLKYFAKNHRN